MSTNRKVRDFVDLPELTKGSKKISFLNSPNIYGATTAAVVAVALALLQTSVPLIILLAILAGIIVYFALETNDDGYSLLAKYSLGAIQKYKNRRSDTVQALNYYNLEYKERHQEFTLWQKLVLFLPFGYRVKNKATVHVASLLGILGAKENLIKTRNKKRWVALYDIVIDTLPSTAEEEAEIEENIQEILNILHNRKLKSRIFFTKNKLGKNNFKRYFSQLKEKKLNNSLEELKKIHIEEIKKDFFDTTQNNNIKMTLAIDMEIPFRFLKNQLGAWNKAKRDLAVVQEELNAFKNIKVVKKENLEMKAFISELTNPLNIIDPRKMFIEEKIQNYKDTEVDEEDIKITENDTFSVKIKKKYLKIKKKIGVYTLSSLALSDLREDVLFYLPESIKYDEVAEEIKVEDYTTTNLVIPTNNRLLSDEIVRFLLRYPEVYNVVFNLETASKGKVIKELEQKEYNTQSSWMEKQERRKLGTTEKRTIEGVTEYVDYITKNNDVEMFYITITIGIATKKGNLKQIAQTIKEETYSRFGIKPHKALFNQQLLHQAVLFTNVEGLNRYNFLIDSSRIPRLTPISSYTFKDERGAFLGVNNDTLEPTFLDLDSKKTESKAKFIFAPTGYGKSTLLKILAMRSAMQGYRNIILDITGEYTARLAEKLGMKIYKIGGKEGYRINPFELFCDDGGNISTHIQRVLIPVLAILLNDLEFNGGLMDKVLHIFYGRKGEKNIKTFVKFLKNYTKKVDGEKKILLERYITELERYTTYSLANVFGEENNFSDLQKYQNIIFDISELDATKGAGDKKHIASVMHIIISNLWIIAEMNQAKKQTFITIDEAHRLLKSEETAEFLAMLVKEGRRERMSLVIASQDPTDFFNSISGKKIIDNIPIRFYSGLNHVEKEYMGALSIDAPILEKIKKLNPGEFFVRRGEEKMFLKITLSETEKRLCDTTHSYYKSKN